MKNAVFESPFMNSAMKFSSVKISSGYMSFILPELVLSVSGLPSCKTAFMPSILKSNFHQDDFDPNVIRTKQNITVVADHLRSLRSPDSFRLISSSINSRNVSGHACRSLDCSHCWSRYASKHLSCCGSVVIPMLGAVTGSQSLHVVTFMYPRTACSPSLEDRTMHVLSSTLRHCF